MFLTVTVINIVVIIKVVYSLADLNYLHKHINIKIIKRFFFLMYFKM